MTQPDEPKPPGLMLVPPPSDAPAPSPDEHLADLLKQLEVKADDLRALSTQIGQEIATLAESPGDWLATFLVGENIERIGATICAVDLAQAQTHGLAGGVLGGIAAASEGRSTERAADSLASGMARSVLSCPCGRCVYCQFLLARGQEVAEPEIRRRLRNSIEIPKRLRGGSGLVGPGGRPLG